MFRIPIDCEKFLHRLFVREDLECDHEIQIIFVEAGIVTLMSAYAP